MVNLAVVYPISVLVYPFFPYNDIELNVREKKKNSKVTIHRKPVYQEQPLSQLSSGSD